MMTLDLVSLFNGLDDDLYDGGGLPCSWRAMNYGHLWLREGKLNSIFLRFIQPSVYQVYIWKITEQTFSGGNFEKQFLLSKFYSELSLLQWRQFMVVFMINYARIN